MDCSVTQQTDLEPERVDERTLRCPACGQLVDEETLETLDGQEG